MSRPVEPMPDGNYIAIIPKHGCRGVYWSLIRGEWTLRDYRWGIKFCPYCGKELEQVDKKMFKYADAVQEHLFDEDAGRPWVETSKAIPSIHVCGGTPNANRDIRKNGFDGKWMLVLTNGTMQCRTSIYRCPWCGYDFLENP